MDPTLLLRGLALGLAVAAPVGPISLLCMRRTLASGFGAGLFSGLGVATADALYGAVAAFGLTVVLDLLVGQRWWLQVVGGLFLCYLGLSTLRSAPAASAATADARRSLQAYASTLALTLTNPTTILSFAALFAGVGLGTTGGYPAVASLVAGVFLGSAGWWLLLTSAVTLLRARVTPATLRWANRTAGLLILTFGLLALAAASRSP
jgi:threonine/homoserine/homoserine lactone efflux protein